MYRGSVNILEDACSGREVCIEDLCRGNVC